MDKHNELAKIVIHQNDEGLSISYWPESALPEEARNWCRVLEGTATCTSGMKVDLWYTGGYYFFTRVD